MSAETRRNSYGARPSVACAPDGPLAGAGQRPTEAPVDGRPRVVVADDHRAMLDTLVRMLSAEFQVVAAVADGELAVTRAMELAPDLLVLDIAMPRLNGIAAAARLKEGGSTAKVVFVTNLREREFVEQSLSLGEVGFVVKDRLVADLLPAIRTVLAGGTFVSPSVTP